MELAWILIVGVIASIFVGFNIGGSSAGVAWGAPVGGKGINKKNASILFVFFVFFGGWTVGRKVMETLGDGIIPAEMFDLYSSIVILFFIGLGILVANIFKVPVPTSMTTVGSIAGLGLATGTLQWEVLGRIVAWWLVTPIVAFWAGGVVGRYIYPYLEVYFTSERSEGPLLEFENREIIPRPKLGPNTTPQELISVLLVIGIGCYMSFSAGASNIPNAVAPLVGAGGLEESTAIIVATLAIGVGGFTIARRNMDSVGSELTDLPLLAAVIVAIIAASVTSALSYIGIPISLVMATIMSIVGLGWGRASRTATLIESTIGKADIDLTINPFPKERADKVQKIGEEEIKDIDTGKELVRPRVIARFVSFWIIGPTVSAGLSYSFFAFLLPLF